jgi:hypothetical protein
MAMVSKKSKYHLTMEKLAMLKTFVDDLYHGTLCDTLSVTNDGPPKGADSDVDNADKSFITLPGITSKRSSTLTTNMVTSSASNPSTKERSMLMMCCMYTKEYIYIL